MTPSVMDWVLAAAVSILAFKWLSDFLFDRALRRSFKHLESKRRVAR